MRKLTSFTFLSLNGYYKAVNEDTSWHRHGKEEADYSVESLKSGNSLLFGRKTYEMMAGFWPTAMAAAQFPEVARGMQQAEKFVFSRTLPSAEWQNTSIIQGDLLEQVRALKGSEGKDMTILGSGSIVQQCTDLGLIDRYQLMIDPVVLELGTPLFEGLKHRMDLQLIHSRIFRSGVVLLTYERTQAQTN